MKKTLLFLAVFAASAMMVQAATIKWAIGGQIDVNADIDTSVGSFVLAYIGTTSGEGVDAETFNAGVGSTYSIVQEKDWSDFYSAKRNTYATTQSYTAADNEGATYQAFYVKDGKYFLVNDPTIATVAISIDASTGGASTTVFVNGTASSGTSMFAAGSGTTTITSVPEPSVALMGLLGLGMLLKRRKA